MKDLKKNTESRVVDSYYELRSCACGGCACHCTCAGFTDLQLTVPTSGDNSNVNVGYFKAMRR